MFFSRSGITIVTHALVEAPWDSCNVSGAALEDHPPVAVGYPAVHLSNITGLGSALASSCRPGVIQGAGYHLESPTWHRAGFLVG